MRFTAMKKSPAMWKVKASRVRATELASKLLDLYTKAMMFSPVMREKKVMGMVIRAMIFTD